MDNFRDPENGKLYEFAGDRVFELYVGPPCAICGEEFNDDQQGFSVADLDICGDCGGGYGRPAKPNVAAERAEHRVDNWPGSWRDVFGRWSDF